jgi:hypothetical protein
LHSWWKFTPPMDFGKPAFHNSGFGGKAAAELKAFLAAR